jgi:hypothetical protein
LAAATLVEIIDLTMVKMLKVTFAITSILACILTDALAQTALVRNDPTTKPSSRPMNSTIARANLDQAMQQCRNRLKSDAAYQTAINTELSNRKACDDLRKTGPSSRLDDAEVKLMKAEGAVSEIEAKAFDADPDVTRDRAILHEVYAQENAEQAAKSAADRVNRLLAEADKTGSLDGLPFDYLEGRKRAFTVGDIQVRLSSVALGRVRLTLGGNYEGESKDELFIIRLKMINTSATHKADYTSWAPEFADFDEIATLSDDLGNDYKRVDFGLDKPAGRQERSSIYPEKELTDVLVFEPPVDTASHFKLRLPKKNLSADGEEAIEFDRTK